MGDTNSEYRTCPKCAATYVILYRCLDCDAQYCKPCMERHFAESSDRSEQLRAEARKWQDRYVELAKQTDAEIAALRAKLTEAEAAARLWENRVAEACDTIDDAAARAEKAETYARDLEGIKDTFKALADDATKENAALRGALADALKAHDNARDSVQAATDMHRILAAAAGEGA